MSPDSPFPQAGAGEASPGRAEGDFESYLLSSVPFDCLLSTHSGLSSLTHPWQRAAIIPYNRGSGSYCTYLLCWGEMGRDLGMMEAQVPSSAFREGTPLPRSSAELGSHAHPHPLTQPSAPSLENPQGPVQKLPSQEFSSPQDCSFLGAPLSHCIAIIINK